MTHATRIKNSGSGSKTNTIISAGDAPTPESKAEVKAAIAKYRAEKNHVKTSD